MCFCEVTIGIDTGENMVALGSSAPTRVRERLRIIESNKSIEVVNFSDECPGCAQTSNRERSYNVSGDRKEQ
jgi:hypothetical protein